MNAKKATKKKEDAAPINIGKPRLRVKYETAIRAELAKRLKRDNVMAIPKLEKIVVNMGVGRATQDKKFLDDAVDALTLIAGQKPVITLARQAIAGFRLREGLPIGCKVTLRSTRMYEFMDRLLSFVLPRVRDFRGVNPDAFDGRGNYSLGIGEYLVFPELNPDKFTRSQGMNIVFVTTGHNDDEGRELLRLFGMPFRDSAKSAGAA